MAHNAGFDMGFINQEFLRLDLPTIDPNRVIDTLSLARRRHPMGPNSLDALCKRYGIDNSHRTKHGALLDSELLAEVYIEMKGGRQAALGLDNSGAGAGGSGADADQAAHLPLGRTEPLPPRITKDEQLAHAALLEKLGDERLWNRYLPEKDQA